MRPVRLLEVGLAWPPETFLRRKIAGLAERGYDVTVAARCSRREARQKHLPGARLVRLPLSGEPWATRLGSFALDALALGLRRPRLLARVLRAVPRSEWRGAVRLAPAVAGADVVHFEWESASVRLLPLMQDDAVPVVVSCRGSGVNVNPYAGWDELADRYPEVFARADAVHCISAAIVEQATRFGLDPEWARVIRGGVDAERFRPAPRAPDGELRIVGVGDLLFVKGYDGAIAAIALLAAAGVPVSYEILGGDPNTDTGKASERARLLFMIHDLGLADRVRLLGRLDQDLVCDRLQGADVLLQASLAEGLPNAVLEAMACALPVVVTDVGGLTEAVTNGVEGIVVPHGDPPALAAALERLYREPEVARRMGRAGRARVLAEFTVEAELDAFDRLYEEVIARRPRR